MKVFRVSHSHEGCGVREGEKNPIIRIENSINLKF